MSTPLSFDADLSAPEMRTLLERKQTQIDALLEITSAINSNLPSLNLFKIYTFTLLAQGASRVAIWYKEQNWILAHHYNANADMLSKIDVEKTLLPLGKQSMRVATVLLPNDLPFDTFIPVYHKAEPLAVALISSAVNPYSPLRQELDLRFIQTITNIIIVAIENKRLFRQQLEQERIKKELEVAERVQALLVPSRFSQNKKLDMEAIYMPHHNIGGDYYDYVPLNEHEFLVCMADISGKGIAAALLMANVQATVRALARETADLGELVSKLNQRLLEVMNGDKFVTLFIAKHNLETHEMTYINAGHNPPVLCCDGKTQLLKDGCTVLGHFEQLPFVRQTSLQLQPNTVVVAYTDGLTELENDEGEQFGHQRLMHFSQENFELGMSDFNELLLQQIKIYKGLQTYTDDISVLSYRII